MCPVVGPCLREISGVCQRDQNRRPTFLSAFGNTVAVGWELWNDRRSVPLCADCAMTRSRPKAVPVDGIVCKNSTVYSAYPCDGNWWETHVMWYLAAAAMRCPGSGRMPSDGNKVLPCQRQYTKHGIHDIQPAEWTLKSGAGRTIVSHQPSDTGPIASLGYSFRSSKVSKLEFRSARALGPKWMTNLQREFSRHQFTYVDSQYPCQQLDW